MSSRGNDTSILSGSNSSSVDWECDTESRSWSSSASWSDDIEGEATERLQQQLEDIDRVLYGEASARILPPSLRQEVAQWKVTFPHLRICGVKPPYGPRPSGKEEGEEEVYASHGQTEEDRGNLDVETRELQDQLCQDVMSKLFMKVKHDVFPTSQKSVLDYHIPSARPHQREPLLAHRQSAHRDNVRKETAPPESKLGGILRVRPLSQQALAERTISQTSKTGVVLPPIDSHRGLSSSVPMAVLGRQTRFVLHKTKASR